MKKSIIAGLALFVVLLFGCKKEDTPKLQLAAPFLSGELVEDGVQLRWQPVINALSYRVEYKKSTDADYLAAGNPGYSPFVVTGLDFGNTYDFRVKSVNGDVESEWSNVVSIDVVKYLPKPVPSLEAGISYINVAWEPVEGATSYRIEHKLTIGSEYTTDYTGNGQDDNYHVQILGLESGVSYDVRIAAMAEGFSETYSDIASIPTLAAPSALISTAAQLVEWLSSVSATYYDVAALANDIDMDGVTITSASGFAGTLEGQGFSIKNLHSSVPLFAENNGTISNIVIDESCSFTPTSNVFGAFVAKDNGGIYISVKNRASVIYTASGNISTYLAIGGIIGESKGLTLEKGATLTKCSNSGAISIEASGYSHQAVGLGGLVGYAEAATFESCVNRGPVSLKANFGNPRGDLAGRTYNNSGGGINVGGILGGGQDYSADNYCVFTECQNESAGIITLNHTKIDGLAAESGSGIVAVGGVVGRARGDAKKCKNWAPVNVSATSDSEGADLQNYVVEVGGIAGVGVWGLGFESCSMESDVNVVYDGRYGSNRIQGAVGGICGRENQDNDSVSEDGATHAGSFAYYCKMKGKINVSGRGTACVGGIFGICGAQIGNQVTNTASISFTGYKGSVGGLVGYCDGPVANYTIKGSSCAAPIVGENYNGNDESWFGIGGLMGRWGGAKTNGYPIFASQSQDNTNTPCSFSGSISSTSLSQCVGIVIGDVRGQNMDLVFGDANHKIQATGTFAKKGLDEITINSDNVLTYAWGRDQGANITMYVESPTAP